MKTNTRTIDAHGKGVAAHQNSTADAYAAVTTSTGHCAEIMGSRSVQRDGYETLHFKLLAPNGDLMLDLLEQIPDPHPLVTRSGQALEAARRLHLLLREHLPDRHDLASETDAAIQALLRVNLVANDLRSR